MHDPSVNLNIDGSPRALQVRSNEKTNFFKNHELLAVGIKVNRIERKLFIQFTGSSTVGTGRWFEATEMLVKKTDQRCQRKLNKRLIIKEKNL